MVATNRCSNQIGNYLGAIKTTSGAGRYFFVFNKSPQPPRKNTHMFAEPENGTKKPRQTNQFYLVMAILPAWSDAALSAVTAGSSPLSARPRLSLNIARISG